MTKLLVILEYDVADMADLEQLKDELLGNLGFLSDEGARPGQLHLVRDLPAYKVLSLLEGVRSADEQQAIDSIQRETGRSTPTNVSRS